MSGCFGNSDYDRYMERELDSYLDSCLDFKCLDCGEEFNEAALDENDNEVCPYCLSDEIRDNSIIGEYDD